MAKKSGKTLEEMRKELEGCEIIQSPQDTLECSKKRTIELLSKIEAGNNSIIREVYDCVNDPECDCIVLLINTLGGDLLEAFAIYDLLEIAKKNGKQVITIGMGRIMSAGVLLLVAGTQRYISRNASIMIHGIKWQIDFASSDMLENHKKQYKRYNDISYDILARHTKMLPKKIKKYLGNNLDNYLTGDAAIEYGLVDGYYNGSYNEKEDTI